MTAPNDVTKEKAAQSAEQKAAVELVRLAQEQGLSLTGLDGQLRQPTKMVLETALNEEMTEHLAMRNTTRQKRGRATFGMAPEPRRC
jgi:putative transposase